jgi:hypothetical protein
LGHDPGPDLNGSYRSQRAFPPHDKRGFDWLSIAALFAHLQLSDPDAVGSAITNFHEPQVRFSHRAPAFVALWCRGFDRISRLQLEHLTRLIE